MPVEENFNKSGAFQHETGTFFNSQHQYSDHTRGVLAHEVFGNNGFNIGHKGYLTEEEIFDIQKEIHSDVLMSSMDASDIYKKLSEKQDYYEFLHGTTDVFNNIIEDLIKNQLSPNHPLYNNFIRQACFLGILPEDFGIETEETVSAFYSLDVTCKNIRTQIFNERI